MLHTKIEKPGARPSLAPQWRNRPVVKRFRVAHRRGGFVVHREAGK